MLTAVVSTHMPSIDRDALDVFARETLRELGLPSDSAAAVSTSLVEADIRGHQSHGVRLLPNKYADEIATGRIDPAAQPSVESGGEGYAVVDGNWSFGHLVGRKAVDVAVERAQENGISTVGLKRTSHIGRIGEWAERATDSGCAFLAYVCNPGNSWVAPAGSGQRRFSTNPIAMGLPTFDALEFPFVLDIATSQVAYGKIRKRVAENKPLPDEWAIGRDGEALVDSSRIANGDDWALLPLGGRTAGYKGFGLSFMSELLATHVTDSTASGADDVTWGNHAVFVVIDLKQFTTRERIEERTADIAAFVRDTDFSANLNPGAGARGDQTLLPGEAEHHTARKRRQEGIPIPDVDVASLVELARRHGLEEDEVPPAFR